MESKKAITVFTASKARELLKAGYTIIDLKPNKSDPEGKKSIFVFRNEEGLWDMITKK